jgi:hypothetical protein
MKRGGSTEIPASRDVNFDDPQPRITSAPASGDVEDRLDGVGRPEGDRLGQAFSRRRPTWGGRSCTTPGENPPSFPRKEGIAIMKPVPKRKKQTQSSKRLSLYAQFTERGYQVKAYISGSPKTHFVVRVSKGGKRIREEHLPPMRFEPRFGVDQADRAALEAETDKFLRALP